MKTYIRKTMLLTSALLIISNLCAEQTIYTLEECRSLALKNNTEQKIANEEIRKADYERRAARTKYFPDISLKGAYMRSGDEMSLISEDMYLPIGALTESGFAFTPDQINNKWVNLFGQMVPLDADNKPFDPRKNPEKILWKEYTIIPKDELTFDTRNVFVAGAMLTQPIFYGGKIIAYNKITKLKKELAENKLNTVKEEVVVKVDETYWQVISLHNKRETVKGLIKLLEKMEKDVANMVETGVATKADQLSVAVKKNEAEMTLMKIDNGIHLSKMLLAQYCGLPLDQEIFLADESKAEIEFNLLKSHSPEEIYSNRSELKSLNIAEQIYKQKEKIERAKLMPTLSLIGSYMGTNPSLKSGFDNSFAFDWHVGVMVNVPLLHWGENIFTLKAAKCETAIAQHKENDVKEKINLQAQQSAFQYNEALSKVELSRQNYERAVENLRYATLGFEEGVIPASNLLEAQTAWLSASSDKTDAEIEAKVSELNYQKATGTLFEKE